MSQLDDTCLSSPIRQDSFICLETKPITDAEPVKAHENNQKRIRNGPMKPHGCLSEAPHSPGERAVQHNPPQQPRRHTTRPERAVKTQFPSQETQEAHRIHILATKGSMKPEATPSTAERVLQK